MIIPSVNGSPQAYARAAGILFLISFFTGGFGEMYVQSMLVVSGDAAATAQRLQTLEPLFRLGFASYLVEAVCDISLTLLLYVLLKPVHRELALLGVFFRLVSTSTFAIAEFFYFISRVFVGGAAYLDPFTPEQLHSLALLSLKLCGYGGGMFMVFYGLASAITGALMWHSGYLPRSLGALLFLGGLGFVYNNFALVLAPAWASDFAALPMALAVVALIPWLLIKGVDRQRWDEQLACR